MQSVSQTLVDTIEQDVSLGIYSRVVADWELNSYYGPEITGSESIDDEMFPIESIALPRRPVQSGLPKLVVNQSRITTPGQPIRYRVPSPDSNYKYYHSRAKSDQFHDIDVFAQVLYPEPVPCNRIVAGFETSFTMPTTVRVLVSTDGEEWDLVGLFAVDADSRVELYRQEPGVWGTTIVDAETNFELIRGVRIEIIEMDGPDQPVSIIQLSPRLGFNLTDRVIDVDVSRTSEDYELTNPIGGPAAGTADIILANDDRFFDFENTESVLYRLMDRNVEFIVSDIVIRNDGVSEGVPQGVFFADDWNASSDGRVSVNCTDRSKFMQETIIENSFYWNLPIEQIVPDIVERFGHTNYDIKYTSADLNRRVPYVFFKNNQTVWEALKELALAEQASFYFDEQDQFVWTSRDHVWQASTPLLTLRNEADGALLPNLIEMSEQFSLTANKVLVKYIPLQPAQHAGQIINNVVWEESNTTVLEASFLRNNMTTSSTIVTIDDEDWGFFPEDGIINIGGEYMAYTKSSTTGRLDITERGLYNSTPQAHNINPIDNFWKFYVARSHNDTFTRIDGNNSRGRHLIRNSMAELTAPPGQATLTSSNMEGGTTADSYAYYACELVFPVSFRNEEPYYDGQGTAGLFIHSDGLNRGYAFELIPTQFAIERTPRLAEVRMYRRNNTGRGWTWFGPEVDKSLGPPSGRQMDILPGVRYRIEVLSRYLDGANHFDMFVNGQGVLSGTDTVSQGLGRTRGFWGVFARYNGIVRFESVMALDSSSEDLDISSFMTAVRDRVSGGFLADTADNVFSSYNRRRAEFVYEDFGPWVHAGHEYDVDYEIAPNVSTDLFVSNDNNIHTVFHKRDPFRSRFAVVSKARGAAVAVGSDPSQDNENMSMFVYGRPIVELSENTVERTDKLSVLRRGAEELELNSPWIQTKDRATRIADWIVDRWGNPTDIVEIGSIIYPHLQVGDLVAIDAADEHYFPSTHQYNVVAISKTVGSEHNMTLTLRRRR